MHEPSNEPPHPVLTRRHFLTDATAAAAALYGVAALSPGAAPAAAQVSGPQAKPKWDMSWVERLTSPHRAVFDSPEIAGGDALGHVMTVRGGYKEVYGPDTDFQAVLVMRASGVRLAFNDTLWQKYKLNDQLKIPGNGNPHLSMLAMLQNNGVILLACNLAATWYAQQMAVQAGADVRATVEEVRINLAPGVTLMPSGIFATIRAQEAGCQLLKSS
ncbi:MAG: hypothetical protein HOP28_17565 [Gemmatimonadales bacterium]|nr:hypothetical protein [Gemmatimonadales bacterium]